MVNEEEYINKVRMRAVETVRFFSNDMKANRERIGCADFLRALGIGFSSEDLVALPPKDSPPDVIFCKARFEVCEALDKERKRHDESKAHLERLKGARRIEDTYLGKVEPRKPLSYGEAYAKVIEVLTKKFKRYGLKVCSGLDALVLINLVDKTLNLNVSPPACDALLAQGWRSVSFFRFPYSHVIHATEAAPDFLRRFEGQTRQEFNNWDEFSEL